MNYQSIIFDMDGTIIKTNHIWKLATQKLITERGIILSENEWQELNAIIHGLSLPLSIQVIKDRYKLTDSVETLINEKEFYANSLYAQGIQFIDGFVEFHKQIDALGISSAIATNAVPTTVAITDQTLNLKQFFGNHLYHMGHVNYRAKPDPSIFLYAAQQLITKPEHCIVIEDSPLGIHAAKKAGMYCIAINSSGQKEKLQEADFIIENYHDLDISRFLQKR